MTKIIGAPTLDDALAALSKRIGENEARGEKNLIFCEDRLTLLAERAVLACSGGTFLTEVTTMARFLTDERRVLTKQGSVMEISALIEEYGEELECFPNSSAGAVYETIAQLAASRVTADLLRAGADETEGMLAFKLRDLAFLLEKYGDFLRENGMVDENGYLALLPEKIASGILSDTNVFFFAFPSFTKQAREGVRAAVENARSVTGIFVAGREELYTNEGAGVFRRIAEECGEAQPSMVRCSLEGDALILRDALFSPERFALPSVQSERVHIFGADDEAEEMDTVAALVRYYAAQGVRYRDIAVLVPDASGFSAAEKAFNAYRIPFFADKKRAFSAHPFCRFALSLLRAVAGGVLPEDADDVAANVCFGESDEYRNYLLKYGGYRGAVKREIKEGEAVKGYDREALAACRERMLSLLALFPKKGKGSVYAGGVRALLAQTEWEEISAALSAECTPSEQAFLSVAPLEGVLNEIETVAGNRSFTAREFADVFENGLSALEISMIPQSLDAVFVGDVTESRFARAEIVFAVGLTDALPRVSADTAVITDGEMKKLAKISLEIEPAIAQVNARARESLALNLCSFRRALYLSCPSRRGGTETTKGEVLAYAEKIFIPAPMPEIFPFDCCEKEPAALRLLALKADFEAGRDGGGLYSSLSAALGEAEGGEFLRAFTEGGEKESVPAAKDLYFAGGYVSPTLLEGYFSCPYAGFVTRALRLREREERSVLDTDAGTFVHAVLEKVAGKLNELETEEACREYARKTGEELLSASRFAALADTRAGEYTGQRLVEESAEVSAAAYRQLALSAFRVRETEENVTLPALSLAGKADRVDASGEYVRVIDYKTGAVDDSATSYYTGRKLQLQLYLLAAAQGGKAAGAFYFPAADEFSKEGEEKYRMKGFFSGEDGVVSLMDRTLKEGDKSALFEGSLNGKFTDKGMKQEDFDDFLHYAYLVSAQAEDEMRAGNIAPSPYDGACSYCKLKGMCGFVGEPRKERAVSCGDIVRVVKKERGEL